MCKVILKNFNFQNYEKLILLFSLLGLIPFFIGLVNLWLNYYNSFFLTNIIKNYGVIILVFLGANYWGIAINPSNKNNFSNTIKCLIIVWSILPVLYGFIVLGIEENYSYIILSFGFIIVQIADEFFKDYIFFPKWYILLRRILTTTVFTVLIIAFFLIKEN